MGRKNDQKPYKIIGAYDSETTNISNGIEKRAFPILHQLGMLSIPVEKVTNENVEKSTDLYLFRHSVDLYEKLNKIAETSFDFVPVICCHNLSFDMYGLAPFLDSHNVRVLAKSERKPISFTILDDDEKPRLVIWDTLVFSQKSLSYMGDECGYPKLSGDWDYDLVRTPDTLISDLEVAYASHDVYALLAWIGYWCRMNPDISPTDLALRVVSKTGVVRRRRVQRFSKVRGVGNRKSVGDFWGYINHQNLFKSDDELYTCQAATRGGFTFCSSKNASRVFDLRKQDKMKVYGFDATSQHPSQMVSHRYPVRFSKATPENLTLAFKNVSLVPLDMLLHHYEKPFACAFYGCFEFSNLRPKKGSVFERFGIMPLAWARCKTYKTDDFLKEDNQQGEEFREHLAEIGYRDSVENPVHSFGKLESAKTARLWITELAAWEISQAYDFDSVKGVSGYMSMSFDRPPDMATISVMQFYAAKNAFKKARGFYYDGKPIKNADDLRKHHIPDFVIEGMQRHMIDDSTVESTYLGLKADLNSLFGIEACNEYRRDTVLTSDGIKYEGEFGIKNTPKNPKAWYQMGQRIVGWSRIAQCVVMMLCAPFVEEIINGDTDSVKFLVKDKNVSKMQSALHRMEHAIDVAKRDVCTRVQKKYQNFYNPLDGIGHYVLEFSTFKFCASWNKAYAICEKDLRDNRMHVRFTLAGVPSKHVDALADELMEKGWSFSKICDVFLGYNVTYSHDITGLNARSFPDWGSLFVDSVTDYKGKKSHVAEPSALCLYPIAKTVNDTSVIDNLTNMHRALQNRPSVNIMPIIVTLNGIQTIKDLIHGD